MVVARRARHSISADGSLHTLTLYDGERYEGVPGQRNFRIVRFAENVIPVRIPTQLDPAKLSNEAVSSAALAASGELPKRAELHWRVALPTMCVVLTMLAVPLAKLRPRQGRYARIWIAVLIYFIYVSLASAAKVWIERGAVPEWLGLWWVHAVMVAITLLLLLVPGWRARLRYRPMWVAP